MTQWAINGIGRVFVLGLLFILQLLFNPIGFLLNQLWAVLPAPVTFAAGMLIPYLEYANAWVPLSELFLAFQFLVSFMIAFIVVKGLIKVAPFVG